MDRSSGILIFSSAYTICILAIICLLQMKYDKRDFQNSELFTPAVEFPGSKPRKPIRYVVMNPIKKDFPLDLQKTARLPNMLVATLPAESVPVNDLARKVTLGALNNISLRPLVEPTPNAQIGDNLVTKKLGAWSIFTNWRNRLPSIRFSADQPTKVDPVAAVASPLLQSNAVKNAGFKRSLSLPVPNQPVALDPHLWIANDFETHQELHNSLTYLLQTSVQQNSVNAILNELDEVIENGSMDSSLCESALYRILGEMNNLKLTEANAEDQRLLTDVKSQLLQTIQNWIDLLNGLEPEKSTRPQTLPIETVDFQKLNMAIQSFLSRKFF